MTEDGERVEVESAAALRRWLAANHARTDSVWAVTWKKGSGGPHVAWDEIVDECLCFGWVDSLPRALDERRTMLRISPRDPRSAWSGANKRRVRRLEREGRMTGAGRRAVEAAKANGAWAFLDEVERLEVPEDLARALADAPDARRRFDRFPPSSRRGILEWIKSAKRPATRARRIAETAARAAENRKANFPAGRDAGPPD